MLYREWTMQRTTPFMLLQSVSDQESRTSVELLHMPPHSAPDERRRTVQNANDRQMTLREKFSPFPWRPFLIISLLPVALAPVIVLATAAEEASQGYIRGRDCYPNGLWSEVPGATWEIMDSTYFFTPNLSFGNMKFTTAKIIDVGWDLLIGRGGQLLLAMVNYRVFNEWLVYHMEVHLTSYKLYAAVAFETTTMSTLGVLGKEFLAFGQSNWIRFFRWLAILSMFLSTLYVLSFPTLMAAMTGYLTTYRAFIENSNGNLIPFDVIRKHEVMYVIEDCYRIGTYEKPLVVTFEDAGLMDAVWSYVQDYSSIDEFPRGNMDPRYSTTTSMNDTYTFSLNKSSTWNFEGRQFALPAPTLNITWYANSTLRTSDKLSRYYFTNQARQGDVFSVPYILSHGSCNPTDTYQWGFSYIFLFMVSIFNFVWSCIMVGMWFDTTRASRMYKSGRRPGLLRSILDISAAMREELGHDAEILEESDLRRKLRESNGALIVPKKELKVTRTSTDGGSRRRTWRTNITKGSTF
ncbi:hypothetical protein B0J11DRAFT_520999 [Dendryphion nanum]|uniref:Uncharacterized protein n=1 Tax=Dendryphion nanum TaxID=256645 RepID=A0A9P9E7F9_9PLEO|nr:hypothetical protein B0J11DRAFT_520999 [Dendryphion nanum]